MNLCLLDVNVREVMIIRTLTEKNTSYAKKKSVLRQDMGFLTFTNLEQQRGNVAIKFNKLMNRNQHCAIELLYYSRQCDSVKFSIIIE